MSEMADVFPLVVTKMREKTKKREKTEVTADDTETHGVQVVDKPAKKRKIAETTGQPQDPDVEVTATAGAWETKLTADEWRGREIQHDIPLEEIKKRSQEILTEAKLNRQLTSEGGSDMEPGRQAELYGNLIIIILSVINVAMISLRNGRRLISNEIRVWLLSMLEVHSNSKPLEHESFAKTMFTFKLALQKADLNEFHDTLKAFLWPSKQRSRTKPIRLGILQDWSRWFPYAKECTVESVSKVALMVGGKEPTPELLQHKGPIWLYAKAVGAMRMPPAPLKASDSKWVVPDGAPVAAEHARTVFPGVMG